ncbi:MAG: YeeE/YedE family protein [Firmicutes bacterium]|nr:YeeE/YedE family protein [Bacillota bacterium]
MIANLPAEIPGWLLVAIFCLMGIGLGVVLERSRFCFTTAFQETMEFHNPWILQGVFLFLGISAIVFSAFTQSGTVHPVMVDQGWYTVVGGFLFGVGIAMCGACATGQLFRAGSGYVANWLEFIGAGLGGTLFVLFVYQPVEKPALAASRPITLYGALHLPPLVWGLFTGAVFIGLAFWLRRFVPQRKAQGYQEKAFTFSLKQPWHPYAGGVALAVLTVLYVVLSAGQSMSVMSPNTLSIAWLLNWITRPLGYNLADKPWFAMGQVHGRLLSRLDPLSLNRLAVAHVGHHLGYLALGIWLFIPISILGAFLSSKVAGDFRIRIPARRSKLLWYLIGGVFMGFGAQMALGCNITAWSDSFAVRMDLSGLLFTVGLFPGVWFGTQLDEWIAERIWSNRTLAAKRRTAPVSSPAPTTR